MRESIYLEIRNNVLLRQSIAEYLEVTDTTVYGHAYRKAPRLNDAIVVEIIKLHTGKSLKEIFTEETLKCIK